MPSRQETTDRFGAICSSISYSRIDAIARGTCNCEGFFRDVRRICPTCNSFIFYRCVQQPYILVPPESEGCRKK